MHIAPSANPRIPIPIDAIVACPRTGVIRTLRCTGNDIQLTGGGCEFGDWYGFFSHEKLGGNRVSILRSQISVSESRSAGTIDVQLPCGNYTLGFDDQLERGTLRRTYHLTSLGLGAMGDMVIRSAVRAADFPSGVVGGCDETHQGMNRFMQFETLRATLSSGTLDLDFQADEPDAPGRLGMYTYLRDQPDGQWIMHHRLLTESHHSDEYVLRIRHAAYSSKSSSWVKPLRGILWRACEKHPWIRPTIQVGGNIVMKPGETWTMSATIRALQHQPKAAPTTP